MGLYVCAECGGSWTSHDDGICESCDSPVPAIDGCPVCGSGRWSSVDVGEELFYLMNEGLTPARALYYFLNEVHGVSVRDIAAFCGRSEVSVYNVIRNAEESLSDV